MKVLWLDCETTGLDPKDNDIITIALMIEVDGEIKDTLELKIQPINWDTIQDKALEVNGYTREDLKTFEDPKIAHKKLVNFLGKYVNRYNRNDKYQPAGYNVGFDIGFLENFFKKVGDQYFGSWVDYHKLDVATLVQLLALKKVLHLGSYRLASVSDHFNVEIDAHNALSDIQATRELCYKILNKIEYEEEE